MPKKWSEVESNPVYQALSPEERESARNAYFDDVVKPQVPEEDLKLARDAFDEDTKPKKPKKEPGLLAETVSAGLGQYRSGKQFVKDVIKSTSAGIVQGAGALGEMVEKPIAEGVNKAADILGLPPPMSGTRFSNLAETGKQMMPKDAPIANVAGETLALLGGGEAAAGPRYARPAVEAAKGAINRIGQAGGRGAVGAMASTPADPSKPYAESKLEQAETGAALGGGLKVAGELGAKGYDWTRRFAFGLQGDRARRLWDKAQNLGFRIRPDQTRADSAKVSQSGLSDEDKEINREVSSRMVTSKVGQPVSKISAEWLNDNHNELAKKFEEVYKPGTRLTLDKQAIADLKELVAEEEKKGMSFMSHKAVQAANRLIAEWETQAGLTGAPKQASKVKLPAEIIGDLRDQLRSSANDTSDRIKAGRMHEVINDIDSSIERNHPQLAAILADARPKWRALMTLEYGAQHGFVNTNSGAVSLEGLGEHLRSADPKYSRGVSSHPLAEAGELGEVFGIRGLHEPSIASNRMTGSGQEEFVPTRATMFRYGVQQAKRGPLTRALHEDYLRFGGGHRSENVSPYALSGAVAPRAMDEYEREESGRAERLRRKDESPSR